MAQNRAISEALLVSGDVELTPGVIAAQNLGLRVTLRSMGSSAATSPYLKAEVDRKLHIRPREQFASFRVMRILCNEVREERAGVDEDPSHGFVA